SLSRDPPRALDAQSASRADDANDARCRCSNARHAEDLRVWRRDMGEWAAKCGEGVEPRKRVQQRRRRQDAVQVAKDERTLNFPSQVCLPRKLERDHAENPDQEKARGGAEAEAAGRVD